MPSCHREERIKEQVPGKSQLPSRLRGPSARDVSGASFRGGILSWRRAPAARREQRCRSHASLVLSLSFTKTPLLSRPLLAEPWFSAATGCTRGPAEPRVSTPSTHHGAPRCLSSRLPSWSHSTHSSRPAELVSSSPQRPPPSRRSVLTLQAPPHTPKSDLNASSLLAGAEQLMTSLAGQLL